MKTTIIATRNKNLKLYAVITAAILSVPLIGMQLSENVDWGVFDFILMGSLIFGTGVVYEVILKKIVYPKYYGIVGVMTILALLAVWVMLATG